MIRQPLKMGDRVGVHFAAVLPNAAKQCCPRGAERAVSPTGVLVSRVALLSLQPPLQRIVHYPPAIVELGYEAIRRVRKALNVILAASMHRRCRRLLAHPIFFD
jgi:hypothetical protein